MNSNIICQICRFGDIFLEAYPDALVSKLKTFVDEDGSAFVEAFNQRFTACKVVVKPGSSESITGGKYHRCYFSQAGELVLEYHSVWTNIHDAGSDLQSAVSSGSVPYVTLKSIRNKTEKLNEILGNMATMLGIAAVELDYCVDANYAAMKKASYEDDR